MTVAVVVVVVVVVIVVVVVVVVVAVIEVVVEVTPHVPPSTNSLYQHGSSPASLLPLKVLSMAVTLPVSHELRFCLKLSV